jgi:hypothetical protein
MHNAKIEEGETFAFSFMVHAHQDTVPRAPNATIKDSFSPDAREIYLQLLVLSAAKQQKMPVCRRG